MKNKLIVFIVTFFVMIVITPFVFNKLMNSKFNKMLDNLRKEGIVIKELKNKSSYLLTDRVFLVKIPGEKLDENNIKYIEAKVESKFKNLPVTDVRFLGDVKKIVFTDEKLTEDINSLIKDKIKFLVITPNFKVYKYKVFDNNISDNEVVLSFSGINGVYDYSKNKNIFFLKDLVLNVNNKYGYKLSNFKNIYYNKNYEIANSSEFNFTIVIDKNKLLFKNVKVNNTLIESRKAKNNFNDSIAEINFNNLMISKNNTLKVDVENFDYDLLRKIEKEKDNNKRKILLKKLISKGLDANLKLLIKDIEVKNQKIGFVDLNAKLNLKPDKKLFEKLENKNLEDINLSIEFKTTQKIAAVLVISNPILMPIFMNAKHQNNILITDIEIKKGKIFINGKEIKSN